MDDAGRSLTIALLPSLRLPAPESKEGSMMDIRLPLLLAGLGSLALAGCATEEGTRKFGATRNGAEQIRSAPAAPLSVPPALSRRPPRAGAPAGDDQDAPDAYRQQAAASGPVSPGQEALIGGAGPSAPANIRQRVDQDARIRRENPALTEELLFGDPASIHADSGNGRIIQQSGSGWLGNIF